jgi:gamma-glutamyltranspeptidase/glutathione hydrolase
VGRPPGALSGRDHQEPGSVADEVGRGLDQRGGITRAFDETARQSDHQRLPAKLVEVESFLAEPRAATASPRPTGRRAPRRSHARISARVDTSGCSYHKPREVATAERPSADAPPRRRGRRRTALLALGVTITLGRASPVAAATACIAAEHGLAVAAGAEVLSQGGNAVDAAIAAAAAAGVVNPVSCGLGGGGFMLFYQARTGETHALDYREAAPAAATADALRRRVERITDGPLSVAVPGEPAGLVAAHARFGRLPLGRVLAPAIRYARDGFAIEPHLADGIAGRPDLLAGDPALVTMFLHADGTPRRAGELLRQPDLAASLEALAEHGAAPFYEGTIAAAITDTIARRGGLLTAEDLSAYRVRWRQPLRGRYQGRSVLTMPPPGSGGVLLEALNVLAPHDLGALELGSPTYLHLLASTMQAVFADRARYYGDPDFVDVPLTRLLSAAHAREIRQRVSATSVLHAAHVPAADAGTSHVSIVDPDGNAAAITTTINTAFGSGVVARGTGIILNNEMADFNLEPGATNVFGLAGTTANVPAPGKRPLSSMSPTIVLREGRPEVVIGASGGPMIITGILQTLLALIDFDLDAAAATRAPRIHHQGPPVPLLVEPGISAETRRALRGIGHTVRTTDAVGAVSVVRIGPDAIDAAGAPRKGGAADCRSIPLDAEHGTAQLR